MKMLKSEIEFVKFDSQDVIATSGVPNEMPLDTKAAIITTEAPSDDNTYTDLTWFRTVQ